MPLRESKTGYRGIATSGATIARLPDPYSCEARWLTFGSISWSRLKCSNGYHCTGCDSPVDQIASLSSSRHLCKKCFSDGWYGRTHYDQGFIDAAEWAGPYPTMFRALRESARSWEHLKRWEASW